MPTSARYLESEYYDAFKRVRNRIRRFDPGLVVLTAIERLHSQAPGDIDALKQQPPWNLFLIIKWAIVHGDFLPGQKRELTPREFNGLLNRVRDVENSTRLPSEYGDLLLFLRGVAYQQFWHQERPSKSTLSRQALLFRHLDPGHRFRRWFLEETCVDLSAWIELSFILLAGLLPDRSHSVTAPFFHTVQKDYPAEMTDAFIRSVSKTPAELRAYLTSLEEEKRRDSSEYRERTPLIRYPLINLNKIHYYYSMPVLMNSLGNFVYDTLKRRNPEAFMEKFGPLFEDYVRNSLNYLGMPFRDESELKSDCGSGKVVDFLLESGPANVLIDAKGVEMAHTAMTTHRSEIVSGQAKSSVLKGIEQACNTATTLAAVSSRDWSRQNNFLLIVTFKDLYLGTGTDFHQYAVHSRIDSALGTTPEKAIIPLEHMYFLSIEEFDYLIQVLKSGRVDLFDFLNKCVEADKDPSTKCFLVAQHLHKTIGGLKPPEFIEEEFNSLFHRAASALGAVDTGG